jgi:hypothetical protein
MSIKAANFPNLIDTFGVAVGSRVARLIDGVDAAFEVSEYAAEWARCRQRLVPMDQSPSERSPLVVMRAVTEMLHGLVVDEFPSGAETCLIATAVCESGDKKTVAWVGNKGSEEGSFVIASYNELCRLHEAFMRGERLVTQPTRENKS